MPEPFRREMSDWIRIAEQLQKRIGWHRCEVILFMQDDLRVNVVSNDDETIEAKITLDDQDIQVDCGERQSKLFRRGEVESVIEQTLEWIDLI